MLEKFKVVVYVFIMSGVVTASSLLPKDGRPRDRPQSLSQEKQKRARGRPKATASVSASFSAVETGAGADIHSNHAPLSKRHRKTEKAALLH